MLKTARWHKLFRRPTDIRHILPVFLSVLIGAGTGLLALQAIRAPSKWVFVIIIATAAPSIALLINDSKKLFLITVVADMALGLDIAVQNQGWHVGGPTGYMVSLMTIVLVVGYALWIIERRPRLRFYPGITIPALLYLSTSLLSFYQSTQLQLSLFGFFLKLQVFLMYFYLVNHVETWDDIRLMITTALICLLLESALMVLQYFAGASLNVADLIVSESMANGGVGVIGNRVSGTLVTPGGAALYLNCMLAVTLGSYLAGKPVNRKLALAAFCLGVIALIATSSRGGWVAFAVAMLLILGRAVWTNAGRRAIVLFLIGGVLVGIFFGEQIGQRVETLEEDKSRGQLAYMANNIIKAFPLGVGDNNYDQYLKDEYAHPAWVGHSLWPPHNKYLLNWAELGFQGLIAFWLLLLAPIWPARQWLFRADIAPEFVIMGSGFLGGLVACMIQMYSETFEGRMHEELLWFTIAMLAVINQFATHSKPMSPMARNAGDS
jgi:hypothetical protein